MLCLLSFGLEVFLTLESDQLLLVWSRLRASVLKSIRLFLCTFLLMSLIFLPFSKKFAALEVGVFTATLQTPLVSTGDIPALFSVPLSSLGPC